MKYFRNKKIATPILTLISFVVVAVSGGHIAHAASATAAAGESLGFLTNVSIGFTMKMVSGLSYIVFLVAGELLAFAGTLFNVSLQLTVHLGTFIKHAPVIFSVWSTIRDLASLFLIFGILWAALQMILGLKGPKYGDLIKNIVIAGVLINFSFFFAQVAIDASNIISLQFFNAIAPAQDITYNPTDSLGQVITNSVKNGSGGISGIFSSALRVNQFWNAPDAFTNSNYNQLTQIIISNYIGAIVELLAALSLLAAAIATLWRTVILIFLLGFSAIWIASYAVPQLADANKRWMNHFKSNLVFLPVYLGMMYVAVILITRSDLANTVDLSKVSGNILSSYLQLFVYFGIVLFVINVPLLTAIEVSHLSNSWVNKIAGWSKTMRNRVGIAGWAGGYAARRTIGAGAKVLDEKLSGTRFGNNLTIRDVRGATLGKLATNKFGTGRSFKDYEAEQKKVRVTAREIDRKTELKDLLASGADTKAIGENIKNMKESERLHLPESVITDPRVLKHFKKSDFDAIKKADEADIDEPLKKKIGDKRKEAFKSAMLGAVAKDPLLKETAAQEAKVLKNMIKDMDAEALMDLPQDQLTSEAVVAQLTPNQLKNLRENGLGIEAKRTIGNMITVWPADHEGKTHPGFHSEIKKNARDWGVTKIPPPLPPPTPPPGSPAAHVYTPAEVRRNLGI